MAIGERFRSGGTHGVAQFLADHQHCDSGFDVRREDQPGSGKLKITCGGCGESVSYRAAEAVDLAAGTLGSVPANGDALKIPPATTSDKAPDLSRLTQPAKAGPPSRRPPATPLRDEPRRPGLPSWLPAALIGVLILGGIGLIVAGLLRSDGGTETTEPQATSEQATEAQRPAPTEQPPAATPATPEPESSGATEGGEGAASADVNLDRTRVAGIFTIGIPRGWERDETDDGAVSIHVKDSSAEVRIFYESGERPNGELAGAAAGFLADEHKGAQVSKPQVVRVDHTRAAMVHAEYGGGEEDAVVFSKGGYAFLLLCRVDRGAAERLHDEAEAIMASFDAQS